MYESHLIPGGSIVIGNTWAILHDPEMFPDPDSFRPERFLSQKSRSGLTEVDSPLPLSVFGYGRRLCPGRFMARASLWVVVANLLASFEFAPAKDAQGLPMPVEEKYTSGIVA